MKIAKICPSGGECVKVYRTKLAASLLKVYSLTMFDILSEKIKLQLKILVKMDLGCGHYVSKVKNTNKLVTVSKNGSFFANDEVSLNGFFSN
eukprot:snap_masked-scaffold_23-processed-gene-4.24-mRNA-1 protein AED:1.00 eAED:1.00 QI:0/0/0/0/1/1/2/0/91